jgi:hypothetical protein
MGLSAEFINAKNAAQHRIVLKTKRIKTPEQAGLPAAAA